MCCRRSDDEGSVTVEAAVAIGVIAFVMVLAAGGLHAVVGQLRCTDAAREAARLVARGERQQAEHAAGRIAGGATLAIHEQGDSVRVVVSQTGPLGVALRAEAFAVMEPR